MTLAGLLPHLPEGVGLGRAFCRSWHLPGVALAAAGGCRGFTGPVPPPLWMSDPGDCGPGWLSQGVYHAAFGAVNRVTLALTLIPRCAILDS
jgi:hypothetical protein